MKRHLYHYSAECYAHNGLGPSVVAFGKNAAVNSYEEKRKRKKKENYATEKISPKKKNKKNTQTVHSRHRGGGNALKLFRSV